jgi:uncharacterized membrane protein YvbJ
MNKISEATMREILVKLSEETLYVDDYEVEYVIKYLKDFVEYARKTSRESGTGPNGL